MRLMTLIKPPTPENILLAALNLKKGALIGLPTETVYGLAADAENENAVRRIYEVKGRPFDHPLIVHIGSIAYLEKWAKDIPDYAKLLAEKFWPGPMTLILKRSEIAKNFITGGQESIGLRMPKHNVTLKILDEFHILGGNGIAAPSANIFGKTSATEVSNISNELKLKLDTRTDFLIDGGQSELGIESTIIDCTIYPPNILRPGWITKDNIEKKLDFEIDKSKVSYKKVSGSHNTHYKPRTRVVLNCKIEEGDGLIALEQISTPSGVTRLSTPRNMEEFSKQLYSAFTLADQLNLRRINVQLNETSELAEAILERVNKAV